MQNFWFKRKIFGWGWYPATWQGWLVTLVYIISILALAKATLSQDSSIEEFATKFYIPAVILSIILISIAYKTGETPRWNWGKKDENDSSK